MAAILSIVAGEGAEKERRSGDAIISELGGQLGRSTRLLHEDPENVAERTVDSMAARVLDPETEGRIAVRLANRTPLARPEQFADDHRNVLHSLEILRDEGGAGVRLRGPGSIAGPLGFGIAQVAGYISGRYQATVVSRMHALYAIREAETEPRSPERRLLARARAETARMEPLFGGGGARIGLFVAGGALLPGLAWVLDRASSFTITALMVVISVPILLALFALLSFVLLRGAAVARRRIEFTMRESTVQLWESVGNCGAAPRDNGGQVALIAIVLTAIAWFVLPVVIVVGVNLFA